MGISIKIYSVFQRNDGSSVMKREKKDFYGKEDVQCKIRRNYKCTKRSVKCASYASAITACTTDLQVLHSGGNCKSGTA